MPENTKGLVEAIKAWSDWLIFLLPPTIYGVYKSLERILITYRLTHSSAYKIGAVEKVLRDSIVTQNSCAELHKACRDNNELRFAFGVKELEELKGQGQKTEEHFVRLESRIEQIMTDNQKVLIGLIQKSQRNTGGSDDSQ